MGQHRCERVGQEQLQAFCGQSLLDCCNCSVLVCHVHWRLPAAMLVAVLWGEHAVSVTKHAGAGALLIFDVSSSCLTVCSSLDVLHSIVPLVV